MQLNFKFLAAHLVMYFMLIILCDISYKVVGYSVICYRKSVIY